MDNIKTASIAQLNAMIEALRKDLNAEGLTAMKTVELTEKLDEAKKARANAEAESEAKGIFREIVKVKRLYTDIQTHLNDFFKFGRTSSADKEPLNQPFYANLGVDYYKELVDKKSLPKHDFFAIVISTENVSPKEVEAMVAKFKASIESQEKGKVHAYLVDNISTVPSIVGVNNGVRNRQLDNTLISAIATIVDNAIVKCNLHLRNLNVSKQFYPYTKEQWTGNHPVLNNREFANDDLADYYKNKVI